MSRSFRQRARAGRILSLAALFCLLSATAALPITIKLGSLSPAGSPWDVGLRRLANEWSQATGGQVTVRIFSGGVVGDEPDMIRKVRIGQLNAAGLLSPGLSQIYSGVLAAALPLLVQTDAELEFVLDEMRPFFEAELQDRGFVPIMWSTAGWVYFFSREPVSEPDDLRSQRLWVWQADPAEIRAWQDAGFQVVPLPATELMTGLQSGMVEAFVSSPLVAASYQWFGQAQHMSELRWAPMFGALVVSERSWRQIPDRFKPELIEIAERIGRELDAQARVADREAVRVMQDYGLELHAPASGSNDEWQEIVDAGFDQMIGSVVDERAYDMVVDLLETFRADGR